MEADRDSLKDAVSALLWPFLKGVGFRKVTARKFARERNGVFQQLWVDANGFGGKHSTCIVLCANFPFGQISGYMDPHGFRICRDKRWDMSSSELAQISMRDVISALSSSELEKLDKISTIDGMIESLKGIRRGEWHALYAPLADRWSANDPELMAIAEQNRRALRL